MALWGSRRLGVEPTFCAGTRWEAFLRSALVERRPSTAFFRQGQAWRPVPTNFFPTVFSTLSLKTKDLSQLPGLGWRGYGGYLRNLRIEARRFANPRNARTPGASWVGQREVEKVLFCETKPISYLVSKGSH